MQHLVFIFFITHITVIFQVQKQAIHYILGYCMDLWGGKIKTAPQHTVQIGFSEVWLIQTLCIQLSLISRKPKGIHAYLLFCLLVPIIEGGGYNDSHTINMSWQFYYEISNNFFMRKIYFWLYIFNNHLFLFPQLLFERYQFLNRNFGLKS